MAVALKANSAVRHLQRVRHVKAGPVETRRRGTSTTHTAHQHAIWQTAGAWPRSGRMPFDRCRRARAPLRPCDLGDGFLSCGCWVCPGRAHRGCLRCSVWTMPGFKPLAENGGATRAGANENAGPFAQFVPPHLRGRHAQTTRQERQKKAAARGGLKCVRRIF